MGLTSITGWIAATILFFNFATCIAFPWARKTFKKCDGFECHQTTLGKYHKPFAILSILAVIAHITVSMLR